MEYLSTMNKIVNVTNLYQFKKYFYPKNRKIRKLKSLQRNSIPIALHNV